MVEPQQMQHCCMDIVDVDLVFGDLESEFIGPTIGQPRFHPTTRKPHGECVRMMVASQGSPISGNSTFVAPVFSKFEVTIWGAGLL